MSSSLNGRGGSVTIYLKHCEAISQLAIPAAEGPTYLQALLELLLLLVYYAEAEVDLVGFLEARVHAHDLREGFFGVLERAIAIVQDADTIPELGFLPGI